MTEPASQTTGNADVDAVIESLDGLDQTPLAEQVAIFESAHERLRGALTGATADPDPAAS